jgi:DNA-binding LacI/PurR family transcriptional regulator
MKKRRKKRVLRQVTATQIAKRLGLSQSTVSRAFTQSASIHPKTKERVMKVAHSLGYQPNIIARSLITRQTNIVAVVMANLTDPFYPLVLDQLARRIQSSGRQVLLFIVPAGRHVDDILPSLLQYKVDAIVITSATVSSRMATVCATQGTPVVLFNRYVPGLKAAAICCNNMAGGRVLAEYLHRSGHRLPAFVAGEPDVTTNLDRERGFTVRWQELGVPLHAKEIGGEFSYRAGYDAARRLIDQRRPPDCVFFASDVMAIGGIDALRAAKLRVPDDISVVGFDDVGIAGWPAYELTTIRQPISQMVDATGDMLGFETPKIKRPAHKIRFIEGMLVERKTVMNRVRLSLAHV